MQLIDALIVLAEILFVLLISPLLTGIIRKIKAWMQCRAGASVFQPYRDLWKQLRKGTVMSREASWLFLMIPYVCLGAMLCLAVILPVFTARSMGGVGDMVAAIYVLAIFRFMMVLGGLEGGSSFGGMGSSREMMISAIVEPTLLLSIFSVAAISGSTDLSAISSFFATSGSSALSPSLFLAAAAIFISLMAENSRVPFDNPATHLELTMVHEVMALDHGGPDLGFIVYGSALKMWILGALIVNIVIPIHAVSAWPDILLFIMGMLLLAVAVGVVESVMARLRLLQVPQLLVGAFGLAILALMLMLGA